MQRVYHTSIEKALRFSLFFLFLIGITALSLQGQMRYRIVVNNVNTNIGDCDGFLLGDSDPNWRWAGDVAGCYGTTCNGCTRNPNETLYDETFDCPDEVPGTRRIEFRACENDGAGCVGNTFTGICDGSAGFRADNVGLPLTPGTYPIGPFCVTSSCGSGGNQWCYSGNIIVTGSFPVVSGNDDICSASLHTVGTTLSGNNECATVQSGEVNSSNGNISPSRTVWHRFVAPANSEVTIFCDGLGWDPEIAIYRANGTICGSPNWGNLTEVGNNDDITLLVNVDSRVRLSCPTPGATYYVQIDGDDATDMGNYNLAITSTGTAIGTNDNLCSARNMGTLNLGGTLTVTNQSNLCFGTEATELNAPCFAEEQTAWYRFTTGATIGTEVTIDGINTGSDNIDLQLSLYRSSTGGCLPLFMSQIACDYDPLIFSETMTVQCLEPNTTYYLQVDGFCEPITCFLIEGGFDVQITDNGVAKGPNDDICNATNLGTHNLGSNLSITNQTNYCFTTQPGEPNPAGWTAEQTAWYQFTTGANIAAEHYIDGVNLGGDNIDLQLALWESSNGSCTGTMNAVDSDYDPLIFDETMTLKCLEPNTTYWLQVDGWDDPLGFLVEGNFSIAVTDNGYLQPTNNDICNATFLGTVPDVTGSIGATNQNNFCADLETGEPQPGSWTPEQTVWYQFYPPASGNVEIDLTNIAGDNIDLQAAIYESSDSTCTGTMFLYNDFDYPLGFSMNGLNPFRVRCLDPNKPYWIQVDGLCEPITCFLVEGNFDISINDAGPRATNDSICQAIHMGNPDTGAVRLNLQNNFCADNILEPVPSAFGTNSTVWYTFIAPSTGRVTVEAFNDPSNIGDEMDLQLAVYESSNDTCTGVLTEVESEYDPVWPLFADEEMLVTCLTPGRIYYIMVDGTDLPNLDLTEGWFDIEVREEPGPGPIVNDDLCDAIDLGAVPANGSVSAGNEHNFCATTEAGEPSGSNWIGDGIQQTVWYCFEAPPSGNIFIDADTDPLNFGDNLDIQLALYASSTDSCDGVLTEVESDWLPVIFDEDMTVTCLEPGKKYFLQVDGWPEPLTQFLVEGYFGLTISEDPAFVVDTNDNICNRAVLGVVPTSGSTTLYNGSNYCATEEVGEPNVSGGNNFFNFSYDETVWFEFTTNNNPGTVDIDITNTAGIDASINVYQQTVANSCLFADMLGVADADNLISSDVSLSLPCLAPNTTYFIQVDGFDLIGDWGTFDIQVFDDGTPSPNAPNDSICNATASGVIASGGVVSHLNQHNFCAGEEANEPNVSGANLITDIFYDESVWYSFTTPSNPGDVNIAITNTNGIDANMTLYANRPGNCSFSDLIEVDAAAALIGGDANMTVSCLWPNTLYYIQVDGTDLIGDNGTFDITITDNGSPNTFPSNDTICNATALGVVPAGGNQTLSDNNFCAGEEAGEPGVSGGTVLTASSYDETVWYTFTTSATPGLTTVEVINTTGINPNIDIYSIANAPSCNFSDLTRIAFDDNGGNSSTAQVDIECLTPNTTFYVQVDGNDLFGDNGTYDIRVRDDGSANAYAVNDSICNATATGVVPSGGNTPIIASHNFCSGEEPGEPNVSGGQIITANNYDETVWFTFTTSATPGTVTIDVFNTSGIDATIVAYEVAPQVSCNFGDLTFLRQASNLFNGDATLDLVCLDPNTTYYFQVDGNDLLGEEGTFDVRVSDDGTPVGAPPENQICNAVAMGNPTGGSVTYSSNNNCADTEPGEPGVTGVDETVWYTFVAPTSGQVDIDIVSNAFIDVNFSVYHQTAPGCAFADLDQLGNNVFDLLSRNASTTETCLVPGDIYYLQVDGTDLIGDYGDFTITVTDGDPTYTGPVNDPCAGALPLNIQNRSCQATGNWQTFNYGQSVPTNITPYTTGCGDNCGDLWYYVDVPANSSGTIHVEGNDEYGPLPTPLDNNSDLTVIAYSGPCGALSPINCDNGGVFSDPSFFITGVAGQRIYFQVFDNGGNGLSAPNDGFALCVSERCGADDCLARTQMVPGIPYCFDTQGANGEVNPTNPGYEECGQGVDPDNSVYFSFMTDECGEVELIINADIGGSCILGAPTDGISVSIYEDDTPCDWNPDALLDCNQWDICYGPVYYFRRVYSNLPPNQEYVVVIDGFSFLGGDNSGFIQYNLGTCVLPTDLVSFTGFNQDFTNHLDWEVEASTDLEFYEIQRSFDGDAFDVIGQINPDGTPTSSSGGAAASVNENAYHYLDTDPQIGPNYYRLRMVDLNGSFSYTDVIQLDVTEPGTGIMNLYPNPATSSVNVEVLVEKAGRFEIALVDVLGHVVYTEQVDLTEGVHQRAYKLDGVSAGLYTFLMKGLNNSGTWQRKFVKQ